MNLVKGAVCGMDLCVREAVRGPPNDASARNFYIRTLGEECGQSNLNGDLFLPDSKPFSSRYVM